MKCIYVAKHDSGGNDDEGAVHNALESLGCEVTRVRECHSRRIHKLSADFLLCHHWHDYVALSRVMIPKVLWCFDLIDWPNHPHPSRRIWAEKMQKLCDLCFFTDGDWAAKTGAEWLMQGADHRALPVKAGCLELPKTVDVLFVGGLGYGRDVFVENLRRMFGTRFRHVLKGCYGVSLADEVRQAKVVVCPDTPVTDRYWSNRVYNMLRLGACVLHPWARGLREQYPDGLPMYDDRSELFHIAKCYINHAKLRDKTAEVGHQLTMAKHTYRHRVDELLTKVKAWLSRS